MHRPKLRFKGTKVEQAPRPVDASSEGATSASADNRLLSILEREQRL